MNPRYAARRFQRRVSRSGQLFVLTSALAHVMAILWLSLSFQKMPLISPPPAMEVWLTRLPTSQPDRKVKRLAPSDGSRTFKGYGAAPTSSEEAPLTASHLPSNELGAGKAHDEELGNGDQGRLGHSLASLFVCAYINGAERWRFIMTILDTARSKLRLGDIVVLDWSKVREGIAHVSREGQPTMTLDRTTFDTLHREGRFRSEKLEGDEARSYVVVSVADQPGDA